MSASHIKETLQEQEEVFEITFARSPASIIGLASKLWLRSINQQLLWIILPAFALLLSISPGYVGEVLREEQIALGFFWGVLVLAFFQLVQSYILYLKDWLKWGNKQVSYRFDGSGAHFQSEIWSGSWDWESFSTLWKRSDMWLLFSGDQPVIMLPIQVLSKPLQSHIARNVAEAGRQSRLKSIICQ